MHLFFNNRHSALFYYNESKNKRLKFDENLQILSFGRLLKFNGKNYRYSAISAFLIITIVGTKNGINLLDDLIK